MKFKLKMLMMILLFAILLTACTEDEIKMEEHEIIEEIQEEVEEVFYEIPPGEAAILLVERFITEEVQEEINRYFYNGNVLEEEVIAWLEARRIPGFMTDEPVGDSLQLYNDNITNALRTRTRFDVIRVRQHPQHIYSVFLEIYGIDYDYLGQGIEESVFFGEILRFVSRMPEVDNLSIDDIDSDIDFDINLGEVKTPVDYLVELSSFIRTSPRSMEIEILLRYQDGLWHLMYLDDFEKIALAMFVERGYLYEDVLFLQRVNGEPASILISRLLAEPMRTFEAANAVTEEQEWALAFGPFFLTRNRESARVLAIGYSAPHAGHILKYHWGVTDRESALMQIRALSQGQGQTMVADEIWNEFIRTQNITFEDLWDSEIFELLEHTTHATRNAAMDIFDFFMEDEEWLEELDDEYYLDGLTVEEYVYEIAHFFALEDRIFLGFMAFEEAREMLIQAFGFTSEELLDITTLAAWDYGRVAIVARYAVAMGYVEAEEVWPYLQRAAISASETYGSWREFTAAHILGRALAVGNESLDLICTLDFLLNHSESPFMRLNFHGH